MKKTSLIGSMLLCALTALHAATSFRVPDTLLDSCVFVMQGNQAVGTAFLTSVQSNGLTFAYLITAKHVVRPLVQKPGDRISLRLNLKDTNATEIASFPTFPVAGKLWAEHTNPAVDIAVVPFSIFDRIDRYKVSLFPLNAKSWHLAATESWLSEYNVGSGDQAFLLGLVPYLFTKSGKNLVVSRFGNIALLCREDIDLPGGMQRAHFLDCAAFGGNSGGPAFVLMERTKDGGLIKGSYFSLLGIVSEFVPSPLRMARVSLDEQQKREAVLPIENTGISKVVPVDYLMDILFSSDLINYRAAQVEQHRKTSATNKISNKGVDSDKQ